MPCPPSPEEIQDNNLRYQEDEISARWEATIHLARWAGAAAGFVRNAYWIADDARKVLNYSIELELKRAEKPQFEPIPPSSDGSNWPETAQLDARSRNLSKWETAQRALERNLCQCCMLIRRALGAQDKKRAAYANFAPEIKAGLDALMAWHATHRKYDLEVYCLELEKEIAFHPPNKPELLANLERLKNLPTAELLDAGPEDWPRLLAPKMEGGKPADGDVAL